MKLVTNDENNFWTPFYFNRDDPKIFVYKNPRHKWLGVTLNFAYGKAWIVLLLGIIFPLVFIGAPCAWLLWELLTTPRNKSWMVTAYVFTHYALPIFFLWLVCLLVYFYGMAAKDAQNYPSLELLTSKPLNSSPKNA